MGAQTTHALMPMRHQSQKELSVMRLKWMVVDYYAGNGETSVSDDVSRRDEAVPDKSSTVDNTHFDFTVNMLRNTEVCSGEEYKETNLYEFRSHLQALETQLKLQPEFVNIRALSSRHLSKKSG